MATSDQTLLGTDQDYSDLPVEKPFLKSSVDPFVSQLKGLCAAHPTRSKWVFVPTHAIGRTFGDRLVLEGTDWANLRFVTPLDVAVRMGAPFLVERGIDPSEEGLGPALIMRLLLELHNQPAYFRPLAAQPTMAQALWTTIRELRMAGVSAEAIKPEAFASQAKYSEFRSLFAAYNRFLESSNRGDMATVYEEAVLHPDWCPIQPQDCCTEMPDVVWTRLQRNLLDAMPGERIVPRTSQLPGAAVPRRLATATVHRVEPETTSTLAFLMSPANAGANGIELFHAGGPDAEVEEVFRRILSAGEPVDDVEIVCASERYATLIWEKACLYNWPVTIASGLPAALTRPGRALIGFTTWIESDFAAGVFRRLLESGDIKLGETETVTPGRAARLLVKSEAAWGRDTYTLSLRRLSAWYQKLAKQEGLSDDERVRALANAAESDELRVWITGILDSIAESADGKVELQQISDCAAKFVKSCGATSSALDAAAAAGLQSSIEELRALGSFRCSLGDALRFIRERVDSVRVGADRPRPGHLYVSTLSYAAIAHRRSLFIVGLEEGRAFPSSFEDPVLLDAEREHIDPMLRRSSDRIDEAVYSVLSRLSGVDTAHGVTVCFSYSSRDLREFRYTFPSWLVLQAYRVLTRDPAKSYEHLQKALGVPKSCVPETPSNALDEAGWWLNGVKRAGVSGRTAILRHYAALADGVRAENERQSPRFSEFDGYVPSAGIVLDPSARDKPVSPTELESAAECPFRYFLRRGLGVDAIDDDDREADLWLDPRTRGTQLHDLYALLLRKCRDEGCRPRLPADADWLMAEGRVALERLRKEMPPPSDEVFNREVREFNTDLELFVMAESEREMARNPVGLEVSFGRPRDATEAEPLASPEPIVIDIGNGLHFRLAGRIDRIDQIDSSSFEIIDYKTGGYFETDWKGVLAGGRRLQHALYGLAAAELLRRKYTRPSIAGGIYYFSAAKGGQERVDISTPPLAAVTAVLSDLRNVIASGLFVHASDESACKWCKVGAACGVNVFQRAGEKVAADPALEPYRKLVAHG